VLAFTFDGLADAFSAKFLSAGIDRLPGDAELGRERLRVDKVTRDGFSMTICGAAQTVSDEIGKLLELLV
jgi:hypothetical protein